MATSMAITSKLADVMNARFELRARTLSRGERAGIAETTRDQRLGDEIKKDCNAHALWVAQRGSKTLHDAEADPTRAPP